MELPKPTLDCCCGIPQSRRSFWVAGVQVTLLAGPKETGGNGDMLEHLVPPGGGLPFHLFRQRTEAFYVVQGRFRFRCGANESLAEPGQFLLLPAGVPHLYQNVGSEWGRLVGTVNPGGLECFYIEVDQVLRERPVDFDRVLEISERHGIVILARDLRC